jgi:hypothetical protein
MVLMSAFAITCEADGPDPICIPGRPCPAMPK